MKTLPMFFMIAIVIISDRWAISDPGLVSSSSFPDLGLHRHTPHLSNVDPIGTCRNREIDLQLHCHRQAHSNSYDVGPVSRIHYMALIEVDLHSLFLALHPSA